jgi:hypothetical protein
MKQFLLARLSPIYGPPSLKIIMFPFIKAYLELHAMLVFVGFFKNNRIMALVD